MGICEHVFCLVVLKWLVFRMIVNLHIVAILKIVNSKDAYYYSYKQSKECKNYLYACGVNVNEKIYQSLAKKFTTPLTKKFTICY